MTERQSAAASRGQRQNEVDPGTTSSTTVYEVKMDEVPNRPCCIHASSRQPCIAP